MEKKFYVRKREPAETISFQNEKKKYNKIKIKKTKSELRINYRYVLSSVFFPASYFMSYHKILKTSPEYTAALKSAREIAKNISKTLGVEVFPYR